LQNHISSFLIGISLILTTQTVAQIDSIDLPSDLTYQIESYIENLEAEVEFDYNTIYEVLNSYRRSPLNLNTANEYQLEDLGLLNSNQINSLLNYKIKNGDLLSLYELQAVPNFDVPTIYTILPFVTVNRNLDDLHETFASIIAKSQRNLFLRWGRNLETPQGFITKTDATRLRLYIRTFYVQEGQQKN